MENDVVVETVTEGKADDPNSGKTFTQEELNSILARERSKLQKTIDDKVSEAQKLADMNAEQKAEYDREMREKEFSEREAKLIRRELMAEAKETLSSKGLPTELAEVLNYQNADVCKASIETVSKAFETAVKKAVEDKLKGGTPPRKATGEGKNEGEVSAFVNIIKENQSKR